MLSECIKEFLGVLSKIALGTPPTFAKTSVSWLKSGSKKGHFTPEAKTLFRH
jgi:hypothetical protein